MFLKEDSPESTKIMIHKPHNHYLLIIDNKVNIIAMSDIIYVMFNDYMRSHHESLRVCCNRTPY